MCAESTDYFMCQRTVGELEEENLFNIEISI